MAMIGRQLATDNFAVCKSRQDGRLGRHPGSTTIGRAPPCIDLQMWHTSMWRLLSTM